MTTIHETLIYTVIECGECGVSFAMSDNYIAARRKDHRTWYCPNGHGRAYLGKNEAEKLRDQLEAEQRRTIRAQANADRARADADHQRAVAAAHKGVATKLKKRIGNGMCPSCDRHFTNLERHIKNQHPDFPPPEAT